MIDSLPSQYADYQRGVDRDADVEDDRTRHAADIEADAWRDLQTKPIALPAIVDGRAVGSWVNNLDFSDEHKAALIKAVAMSKTDDGLRQWHLQAIAAIVIATVERMVGDHAFAEALAAS